MPPTIVLTPQEPALDARLLEVLAQLWLDELLERLPPLTVDGYRYKVAHLIRWWAEVGPDQDWLLRRRDLARFERRLAADGLAWHTRNDVLRRTRQMLLWAHRRGHTDQDYSTWVPPASGEPPVRSVPPLDVLEHLLDAAARQPQPRRAEAIVALLVGTGMRRGEAAGLRLCDLQLHADRSGVATVWGKRTRANASGVRSVAIDAATGRILSAHLDALRTDEVYVFPGKLAGSHLSTQQLYRIVVRTIRAAGLSEQLQACHDLRRAFATWVSRAAVDNGALADLLRRQLGHRHYSMTAAYTLLDADDIRESLPSPLALLSQMRKSGGECLCPNEARTSI